MVGGRQIRMGWRVRQDWVGEGSDQVKWTFREAWLLQGVESGVVARRCRAFASVSPPSRARRCHSTCDVSGRLHEAGEWITSGITQHVWSTDLECRREWPMSSWMASDSLWGMRRDPSFREKLDQMTVENSLGGNRCPTPKRNCVDSWAVSLRTQVGTHSAAVCSSTPPCWCSGWLCKHLEEGGAEEVHIFEWLTGDFHGGPVAKTLSSQCRGPAFDPCPGN